MKTHIIKIDSNLCYQYLNEYKTAFIYNFDPIICEMHQSIFYSIISASIPVSFYSVNKYNQYLDVREHINNTVIDRHIIISAGNYNAIQYGIEIQRLLNSDTTLIYTINYNKINNKYYFSASGGTSDFLFLTGINNMESNYNFLGFNKIDVSISNQQIFSHNVVSMSDIYFLQIKSDLDNNNVISGDLQDNILEIIPINEAPLQFINYAPPSPTKYLYSEKNLRNITIYLIDNMNRPINLNGLSFLINIRIEIVMNEQHNLTTMPNRKELNKNMLDNEDKTNLDWIREKPDMIDTNFTIPAQLPTLIDIQNIQEMINNLSKKRNNKHKSKKYNI
jgi:hypothetical protein